MILRLRYCILFLRYCIYLPGHCTDFISIHPPPLFFQTSYQKFYTPNFGPLPAPTTLTLFLNSLLLFLCFFLILLILCSLLSLLLLCSNYLILKSNILLIPSISLLAYIPLNNSLALLTIVLLIMLLLTKNLLVLNAISNKLLSCRKLLYL